MNENDYKSLILNAVDGWSKWEYDLEKEKIKEDQLMKLIYQYDDWTKNGWYDDTITEKKKAPKKPAETDEQKVVRILKGDFEKKFGMTFEKFIETYQRLLETSPEKLI